ncbi:MAG: thioredoxin domain-containing protein [Gemmatimonadetes bacterium]|nr:thioredoxin domain-containing protein [Gemmatimonadota bacterium]
MRRHMNKALVPVAALLVTLGCDGGGGDGDGSGEAAAREDRATSGSLSQSIPTSMLSDGGTTLKPPAQEFTLGEIGFDFGSVDAPIAVVEFSDYGCGYCRRFHTETFPTLMEEYVETGKVRWKYVTYVSGMFANGLPAAYAAECAGEQDLFPRMSKLLYERQADWKSLGDPSPVFAELAREAGADTAEFQACLADERHRPRVRSGILSGGRLGIRGTPSFLVNGVPLVGAQPIAWWRDAFNAIAAEIEAGTGDPGDGT